MVINPSVLDPAKELDLPDRIFAEIFSTCPTYADWNSCDFGGHEEIPSWYAVSRFGLRSTSSIFPTILPMGE